MFIIIRTLKKMYWKYFTVQLISRIFLSVMKLNGAVILAKLILLFWVKDLHQRALPRMSVEFWKVNNCLQCLSVHLNYILMINSRVCICQLLFQLIKCRAILNANIICYPLGDAFCKSKDLGLNPDQVKACGTYIDAFMPAALKTLGDIAVVASERLCSAAFNICWINLESLH